MSEIAENRELFLCALRSGKYEKGAFIKGHDQPQGATGFCAIGLPYTLLCNNQGSVVAGLRRALGLNKDQIHQIQNEWNDSPLSFADIADKIESEYWHRT